MKRKIIDIKEDIEKLISPLCDEKFWIEWYGAYYINPENLVFWICVQTDKMKSTLKSDTMLGNEMRKILYKHNYPEKACPSVFIDFESQETVNRDSGGSWFKHFK